MVRVRVRVLMAAETQSPYTAARPSGDISCAPRRVTAENWDRCRNKPQRSTRQHCRSLYPMKRWLCYCYCCLHLENDKHTRTGTKATGLPNTGPRQLPEKL